MDFPLKVTPYDHQRAAFEFARDRNFAALFMETGTGKTLVALATLRYWYDHGRRKFVCIVPNTLTGNWVVEAAKFGLGLKIVGLEGAAAKRLKIIQGEWDVLVVNYEALRTKAIQEAIIASAPQALVLDEIQRVKDRRSQQTKGAREIAVAVKANKGGRLGLTGTPVVHSPLDLWSIFDVLDPCDDPRQHPLRYGNYWAFEQGVAIKTNHPRIPMAKLYKFPEDRLATLKTRVAPLAQEARKDDCLDLPPRTFQTVLLDMPEAQQRIHDALKTDYVAFIEDKPPEPGALNTLLEMGVTSLQNNEKAKELWEQGLAQLQDEDGNMMALGEDRRISVAFATTLMIRLQQVCSGHIRTDDGATKLLPENAKTDWLREMLPLFTDSGWKNKTIIFCRYKADMVILQKLCDELKIGWVSLSGENSKDASAVVHRFQTNDDTRVFIGNIQVSSTGITLTAANSVVFYNNSFAAGDREQAIDRAYRIGQTRKVTYYDLVCKRTIDERVLANLTEKKELATATVGNLLAALQNLQD